MFYLQLLNDICFRPCFSNAEYFKLGIECGSNDLYQPMFGCIQSSTMMQIIVKSAIRIVF